MQHARVLSTLHVAAIGTNAIIGAGIYLLPGPAAAALGPASLLAWLACAGCCGLIALTFAAVARRFDGSGGPYRYAMDTFGPHVGFAVGVVCWVTSLFSWATVAAGLGGELAREVGRPDAARPLAVGSVIALGALNYFGVKPGALVVVALTALKLVPLLVLLVAGGLAVDAARFTPFAPAGLGAFAPTTLLVLFAYQGFEVAPVPAGETRRAEAAVPRAVLVSLALSSAIYLGLVTVLVGALPDGELAGAPDALARLGRAVLGGSGETLVRVGAIVSMLGFSAGVALVCPHYLTALSEDGHLPRALGERHPRFGGPTRATLVCTGVTAALTAAGDFASLLDFANEAVCVQYMVTALALIALWRRDAREGLVLGAVAPLGAVAVTFWLFTAAKLQGLSTVGGVVALGFGARLIYLKYNKL